MLNIEPSTYDCAYTSLNERIPQSKLGYHSNNKYDNFPPLMSDGRAVTASYQPEAVLNNQLIKEINVETNWQYRQYLIANANEIIKYNRVQTANDSGYFKRYGDEESDTYSTPIIVKENVKYKSTSDLKNIYLSREELQSRMVAPEVSYDELHKLNSLQ
jgi:hypothetical protein